MLVTMIVLMSAATFAGLAFIADRVLAKRAARRAAVERIRRHTRPLYLAPMVTEVEFIRPRGAA